MITYIGIWKLNSESNTIENNEATYPLEPKLAEVLLYFAEHPGDVVSRDKLIDEVWSGTAVTEHAVNRVITKLRKVLNQGSELECFIKTIPKRGYQLVAEVSLEGGEKSVSESPSASLVSKISIISSCVFMLVLATVYILNENSPFSSPSRLFEFNRISPLTSLNGNEDMPQYSPDGQNFVFTHREMNGKSWNTYIQSSQLGKVTRLTTNDAVESLPNWSPDGKKILIHRRNGNRCHYIQIELDQFTLEAVTEKVILSCDPAIWNVGGIWSNDGNTIYYPHANSYTSPLSIYSYHIPSGKKRKLTAPTPGGRGDYRVSRSPSGQKLLIVRNFYWFNSEILLFDLETETSKSIKILDWPLSNIAWGQDSNHILYANPYGQIVLRSVSSDEETILWNNSLDASSPVYSPLDESVIFVSGQQNNNNIWLTNISQENEKNSHQSFVVSSYQDNYPEYANQSNKLAFFSNRTGLPQIWIKNEDGSEKQLSQFNRYKEQTRVSWSPDDQYLLSQSHQQVYRISVETGEMTYLTSENIKADLASWSHDGKSIFFASDQEQGWQIWEQDLGYSKEMKRVTKNGGYSALTSFDGNYLYFTRYDKNGLWQLDLSNAKESPLISDIEVESWDGWGVNHSGIFYLSKNRKASNHHVNFYDFGSKVTKQLAKINNIGGKSLSISADQKSIVWVKKHRIDTDIKKIHNLESGGYR